MNYKIKAYPLFERNLKRLAKKSKKTTKPF